MEPFHRNHTANLSLEEYAAVSARMHQTAGVQPGIILAQLHIPEDVWRVAAADWERLIDEELARGSIFPLVRARRRPFRWLSRLWSWFSADCHNA